MDETGSTNQGVVEGEKIEKLEHEIKDIEKKAAVPQSTPLPSPPVESASPPPTPPQPVPSSPPLETTPQGTGKSKVVLWVGIALLVLALVAVGAYYLGTRKTMPESTSELYPTEIPTATPTTQPPSPSPQPTATPSASPTSTPSGTITP
ncbi:hypothetical protein KAT60_02670 [Candidatus Woesebacteria bacterium]|nr:hypothetical protein [Candidatus Woesebacteria bacterium]